MRYSHRTHRVLDTLRNVAFGAATYLAIGVSAYTGSYIANRPDPGKPENTAQTTTIDDNAQDSHKKYSAKDHALFRNIEEPFKVFQDDWGYTHMLTDFDLDGNPEVEEIIGHSPGAWVVHISPKGMQRFHIVPKSAEYFEKYNTKSKQGLGYYP